MTTESAASNVSTTFFLVRHATHDLVGGILCGRMPGVFLSPYGKTQAVRVSERLESEDIAAIMTSPLDRARETAASIAARIGCSLEICELINEIDFGTWSGMSFEALSSDPLWMSWNAARSLSRPPGGETMLEVQLRIITVMEKLRRVHSGRGVVLVSHGDVIKAALLYYLGMPIEAYTRFDIDPASISTLLISDRGPKLLRLNEGFAL